MLCPNCMEKTRVIGTQSNFETVRFRRCPKCSFNFTTTEKIDDKFIIEDDFKATIGIKKNKTDDTVQNTLKCV